MTGKLPGLRYSTWDALVAGRRIGTHRDVPAPAPITIDTLADALTAMVREADSYTIGTGGTPGVSDRWAATTRARDLLRRIGRTA